MTYSATILVDLDGFEMEVEVNYNVTPGYAGDRIDPPYPAEVEVSSIFVLAEGVRVPASDSLYQCVTEDEAIMEQLLEEAGESVASAQADAAEARREMEWENDYE